MTQEPNDVVNPEVEETLKGIMRERMVWRVLAALLCIPALLFMMGAEKRIQAAKEAGDVEAAREALKTMRISALIGCPIGVIAIAARISEGL